MPSPVPAVATVLLMLLGSLAAYPVALCDEADRVLDIRLPHELDPAKTVVLLGEYGQGLTISQVDGSKYTRRIGKSTKSAKVLIYYPGFKLVMTEIDFTKPSPTTLLVPKLQRLPTTPLTVRIVGSDGKPVARQNVAIRQPLLEMEYFGYFDGMVWYWKAAPVASGVTDASGRLTVQVPVLLDDPAFAKYLKGTPSSHEGKPWFDISLADDRLGDKPKPQAMPSTIPALRKYDRPIDIRRVYAGRIAGKVEKSFLKRHGIDASLGETTSPAGGKVYRVWLNARKTGSRSGQGTAIKADGSFEMPLLPGKYDLTISVNDQRGLTAKEIPVGKGIVLRDGEERRIVLR